MKLNLIPLVAGVLLLACSGCAILLIGAGAAAGAGTVLYTGGALRAVEAIPFETAVTATDAAMVQLEFAVVKREKDALTARMTARTAMDKKVVVKMEKTGDEQTQVRIRVGLLGDRALSQSVLDAIRKEYDSAASHEE